MSETLDLLLGAPFWVAVLRIATPLILGTLGVLLCERAGVLNLGIEGIMVAGAFAGWLAVYAGAPLWAGVAVAALTGAVFGAAARVAHRAASRCRSTCRGSASRCWPPALAYYGYRVSFPEGRHAADGHSRSPTWQLAAACRCSTQQTPLTLLALLLVPLLAWLLYRTPARAGAAHGRREPAGGRGPGLIGRARRAPARSSPARR